MNRPALVGISIVVILIALIIFFGLSGKETVPVEEELTTTYPIHKVIGTSVEGRSIDAYQYGSGATHIALVGGIHGGYEWNSTVLAYRVMDYFESDPTLVPKNLKVTIIPSANPDGMYKVIGKEGRFESAEVPSGVPTEPGRFNAREVDLNRNFDCKWQPKSMWRNREVSAGTRAFSEPEAEALRKFFVNNDIASAIFWHSQAGAVYASDCEEGILPETLDIMNAYAKASGYRAIPSFDAYETTGDVEGWLAKIGVPALSVELTTHEVIEFDKNLAGIKALFEYYKEDKKKVN